jgi:hypothetical protein
MFDFDKFFILFVATCIIIILAALMFALGKYSLYPFEEINKCVVETYELSPESAMKDIKDYCTAKVLSEN